MKHLAISTAAIIAAFGPPLILITSVDLISGRIQDDRALAFEFIKTVAAIAVWGICAIATTFNRESPKVARTLLRSAIISTAICAVATLAGLFIIVGLFTTFAACLILSLPTLALAMLNARALKRSAETTG